MDQEKEPMRYKEPPSGGSFKTLGGRIYEINEG